jgi:hypothetical protein
MPRELRMIIFDDHEVWDALRRTAVPEAQSIDPKNVVRFHVKPADRPGGAVFFAVFRNPAQRESETTFSETTIRNALVGSCLRRHVRLPAEANKEVHVIDGKLALVIRLHSTESR